MIRNILRIFPERRSLIVDYTTLKYARRAQDRINSLMRDVGIANSNMNDHREKCDVCRSLTNVQMSNGHGCPLGTSLSLTHDYRMKVMKTRRFDARR